MSPIKVDELWQEFGRRAPRAASIIHPSMVFSLRGQKESWEKTLREMECVTNHFALEITEFNRRLDDVEDDVRESGKCSLFLMGRVIGDARELLEECSAVNDLLLGYFQIVERQIRDAL